MARCGETGCDAEIWWLPTATGGRMPVDASRAPGGNIEIQCGIAIVVKAEPHVARHWPHHATCVVVKERRRIEAAARRKDRDQAAARQLGLFGGARK